MRKANPKLSAKLFPKTKKIDTVQHNDSFSRNSDVLMDAYNAWTGLDQFRVKARRNEKYTFDDQWGDMIPDPDGSGMITESQHIKNQGSVPLQNNRIRGIVRSVLGVFSGTQTEPVCVSRDRDKQSRGEIMSTTLQYVYQLNKLWEIDRRNLEYFLITGTAFFKSSFGYRNGKNDVWTDIVNYNTVFFDNHMTDPRHWDCHLVGEIHDLGLYDVMAQFSNGNKETAEIIRSFYRSANPNRTISYLENLTRDYKKHLNFFIPTDTTRCRVIEVWKKESKERLLVHDKLTGELQKLEVDELDIIKGENAKRIQEQGAQGVMPDDMKLLEYEWFIDNYWYYYYMTPTGEVLREGETPYWHESHPYSFKIYPFYNGRVYPFVSDFIDQQRYINRLITTQDFISRNSAKGVLMFPEDAKPDNMSMDEIADEWTTTGGIIYYKAKAGVAAPQQIIANTTQTGNFEMLNMQLKLLEDISGVQGAMQGQTPGAGTPAALFAQQIQQGNNSLIDMFESYKTVREDRDMKNLKLIQQAYKEDRYINLVGKDANRNIMYVASEVQNTEFDLSIVESSSTPAYRMIINDMLMNLQREGQVSLKTMLRVGDFPFSDKLLQELEAEQQQAQEQQSAMPQQGIAQGQVPPQVQQQINAGMQPQQPMQ